MLIREVQRLFLELVTAPEGVAKALEAREARGEPGRAAVAEIFSGDERMPAGERLDVYANMYFFRLRDALAEDFARTAGALGEARWHNLVTDYLLAHPPTSWSLRWAGEALPEFLRGHAYGAERPWLADVAALEQARNEAFQALDAPRLDPQSLAAVPPEEWPGLRFEALPGTALVESRWDLAAWWEGDGSEPPREAEETRALLVARDAEGDVRHAPLDAPDAKAARLLLGGEPFADVCEAYAPASPAEAGRRALALLRGLVYALHSATRRV